MSKTSLSLSGKRTMTFVFLLFIIIAVIVSLARLYASCICSMFHTSKESNALEKSTSEVFLLGYQLLVLISECFSCCPLHLLPALLIMIVHFCRISDSSSSCCAASTDIPDALSSLLPIVHRLWLVFRVASRILT